VKEVKPYGAIKIEDLATKNSWMVNGQRLKDYLGYDYKELTIITSLKEP